MGIQIRVCYKVTIQLRYAILTDTHVEFYADGCKYTDASLELFNPDRALLTIGELQDRAKIYAASQLNAAGCLDWQSHRDGSDRLQSTIVLRREDSGVPNQYEIEAYRKATARPMRPNGI